MLWNKKTLIIGIGILCSVFVSVLSSCASYAIADKSVTYQPEQLINGGFIFPDCFTASCLNDYNYLKIEIEPYNNFSYPNFLFHVYPDINGSYPTVRDFSVIPFSTTGLTYIFELTDFYPYDNSFVWATYTNHFTVTFTLTESYFNCPPVEPCPVIPENPYDDKLDKLISAVYVVAGTMLVIYFFYCIYRMIIKGVK